MIRGCQDIAGSAASGMCIASPGFGPAPRSPEYLVIPGRGSSPSPGAQKNSLRGLWAAAPQLVRSEDAPRAGSLVRRSPDLPGPGAPARGLPELRGGEAGATRLPRRLAVLHQTLCLLRGASLPGLYDSGRGAGDAPELENHQSAWKSNAEASPCTEVNHQNMAMQRRQTKDPLMIIRGAHTTKKNHFAVGRAHT